MINNILMFGGRPKDLMEIKHAAFRYEGTDADTATTYYLGNKFAIPFFKQFGIRNSFELKEKFVSTGATVMIDHDLLCPELQVDGNRADIKGLRFDSEFFRIYNFTDKIDNLSDALIRYQRRFIDENLKKDTVINSIELYSDLYPENSDKMLFTDRVKEMTKKYVGHYKEAVQSYLMIVSTKTGLNFAVCDNKHFVMANDAVLYEDMPDFEKEYENIEF